MNATYFVGTGLDAFTPGPTGCTDGGGAVHINGGGYARARVVDPADGVAKGVTRLWTHGNLQTANYGPPNGIVPYRWYNSAGVPVLRLLSTNGWEFGLQFWDGSAWRQPGPSVSTGNGNFDFVAIVHPTAGRVGWFHDGTLCADSLGLDTSGMVDLATLELGQFQNYAGSTDHRSGIMASYSTIGHTVTRRTPSGAGAHADWTGSYADVDDDATDDTDAITTAQAGAVSTFTAAPIAAPATGTVVKCVAVAARMRSDGGAAPAHARAVLRIGGADYPAGFDMPLGSGFAGAVTCFDADPSTGAAWAALDHVNAEFGLKATA